MAIISILLSCVLGFIAAIVRLAFLGANVGQAFMTYLVVSVVLSSSILGFAILLDMLRTSRNRKTGLQQPDMEIWQDWQAEEAIEADANHFRPTTSFQEMAQFRRAEMAQVLTATPSAAATACSARKAGRG